MPNVLKQERAIHKDKDNNVGENDHDTKDTAKLLKENEKTTLFMPVTNNGTEALTHIKVVDKTIEGKSSVKDLTFTYKGKALKVNKDGELTLDGKLLVLQPKESIEVKGNLDPLASGELHGDKVSVEAVGVNSGKKVGDDDQWYGKVKPRNVFTLFLPKTGMKAQHVFTVLASVFLFLFGVLGAFFYKKNKRL